MLTNVNNFSLINNREEIKMNANQKRYEVTKLETEIAFGRKPSSQKKPKSKTRLMVGGKTGVTVATYRIGHGHIYIVHTVRYFSKYKNNFKRFLDKEKALNYANQLLIMAA